MTQQSESRWVFGRVSTLWGIPGNLYRDFSYQLVGIFYNAAHLNSTTWRFSVAYSQAHFLLKI